MASYPYDAQLPPDAVMVLRAFREGPIGRPDPRVVALTDPSQPVDLQAYLHTISIHSFDTTIGDVWFGAAFCKPLGVILGAYAPDVIAAVRRVGCDGLDLDRAVIMGNTADGEVTYAAAWRPGDARLTVVRFCLSGYNDDGLRACGGLVEAILDLVVSVEDEADLPATLRSFLRGDGT